MKFASKTLAAMFAVVAAGAVAMPEGWTDDFDAAKAEAAKDGKLLLVDFSGSDWCGWCMKLDSEVFSKPEFVEGAKKDFVLVLIDTPSNQSILSEKARVQNPALVDKYGIEGFPSVLILDAEGNKLARTGYMAGGATAYLKKLAELKVAATEKMAFLKSVSSIAKDDPDRLAKLDGFLSKLGRDAVLDCEDYVQELIAADEAKYAPKYPVIAYVIPFMEKLDAGLMAVQEDFNKRAMALGDSMDDNKAAEIRKEFATAALAKVAEFKKEVDAKKATVADEAKPSFDEIYGRISRVEATLGRLLSADSETGDDGKKGKKGRRGRGKKAK